MVVLRGCLASAILIFQAHEEVQAAGLALPINNAEDVALPRFAPVSPRLPQQQAFHGLDHDVHHVQRLRRRQEEALLEHLLHLIADPLVVGEAPFVGGNGEEDARVADLPHHVQQGVVHSTPIVRAEGLALEHEAHGRRQLQILLGTDAAPEVEVINKLEKLEVRSVAQQTTQRQGSKETFHAVACGVICFCVLRICHLALLFAVVVALNLLIAVCSRKGCTPSGPTGIQHVLQGGCPLLPNHPPGIRGTLVSEGALHIPEQTRPEGALHADTFNELQPATASELVGAGVFFQKLRMLGHKGRIGCVIRGHQEVVSCAGLRPHVHVLAMSASKCVAENIDL